MNVPENVRQVGIALRKRLQEETATKQAEAETGALDNSIYYFEAEDIAAIEASLERGLAREAAHQAAREADARESALKRQQRQAEPARKAPAPAQPPEPKPKIIFKPACPVTYGLPDDRPFGDTSPREVSRTDLTAWALNIIRTEGPQSTTALLKRAFGELTPDDYRAMRQRLPKWLLAECRYLDPPLTMKRWRSNQGGEKRDNLFGFWTPEQVDVVFRSRRGGANLSEVLANLDRLQQDVATIRTVQSEILSRQDNIRSGLAAALEKLSWNSEI